MCSECIFITSSTEDTVRDQNMLGNCAECYLLMQNWAGLTAAEWELSSFTMQRWCHLLCGRLCVIQTANAPYVMGSIDSMSSCCKLDTLYICMHCHYIGSCLQLCHLTLTLLTWRIWWANNANKWQMGFNLAFKGLKQCHLMQCKHSCSSCK